MFQSIVIGNLGADVEKQVSNGKEFLVLSIADSRKYKGADGKEITSTTWVDAIISDPKHPVAPFLKQGTKVCVWGEISLRVYSSKKDRQMKAGATIHVRSIELVGGLSDSVPRQLVIPSNGAILEVSKHYWADCQSAPVGQSGYKELIDTRGNLFLADANGFIIPAPKSQDGQQAEDSAQQAEDKQEAKPEETMAGSADESKSKA